LGVLGSFPKDAQHFLQGEKIMQEENSINETNLSEEQTQNEWQAPPPPENVPVEAEPAQMSEAATLGGIFFEPGRTFEDLRRKPRFILAGLIVVIAVSLFNFLYVQKVGFEKLQRERLESNSRVQQMPEADKQKVIEQQSSPLVKNISLAVVPLFVALSFLIGGLIYWLGGNAMGGAGRFSQGISVWVYSGLPPAIIFVVANLIVLFLKSVDDIDILTGQSGLIKANPSFFVNAKTSPVLATLLASFDLFAIWGWVLASIGLQKVFKLSSGAAWAIVLIFALVAIACKVLVAAIFG
jgi:hypothetical protein